MAKLEIPIHINLPDDWIEQVIERFKNDPDIAEIVRCKDCRHYSELLLPTFGIKCGKCNWGDPYSTDERVWEENDFCNHGERRN